MTCKVSQSKWLRLKGQQMNDSCFLNRAYGKPTKPRYQEPSMYEILSWNDTKQADRNLPAQMRVTNYNQINQPQSTKKLIHCKSLPADQLIRSKNIGPNYIGSNFQENQCLTQNMENDRTLKKVKINDLGDYASNQAFNRNTVPEAMGTGSTKYLYPINLVQQGGIQQQNQQTDQSIKNLTNQFKNQKPKAKKLQKKALPRYTDAERKPRYMQEKKSAVQKLIESVDFDKQKFDKMKEDEIKRFKQTTRDLSNSAFLTFFNKPPFENYGRSNNHTAGVLYGDYMYSHNIFPHTGDNKPRKQQTYDTALTRAKSVGSVRPHPPLTRHLEDKLIAGYLTLSQIYPKDTSMNSIPIKNQTLLENIPSFNYSQHGDENKPRYNAYLNANDNEELFKMNNQYLKRDQIPSYFSNKNQIEGKQISYSHKILPRGKIM